MTDKEKQLKDNIERHRLNIERTKIDIKKEVHQKAMELKQAELKGYQEAKEEMRKEFLKILKDLHDDENSFDSNSYICLKNQVQELK